MTSYKNTSEFADRPPASGITEEIDTDMELTENFSAAAKTKDSDNTFAPSKRLHENEFSLHQNDLKLTEHSSSQGYDNLGANFAEVAELDQQKPLANGNVRESNLETKRSEFDITITSADGGSSTNNRNEYNRDCDSPVTPNESDEEYNKLLYSVTDNPPWYSCILLGLQHYLMMVESTVSIPYLLTPLLCLPNHHPARALIASTIIFVSGLITIMQTTVGIRLPIVQGGTHGFLGPILAILALLPCPDHFEGGEEQLEEEWRLRMRYIQGSIALAAVFQVVVGATGAVGVLLKWITPLVIVPTISLIGFALFPVATEKCASQWGIAGLTIVLLIIFSQYLSDVPIPVPTYSKGIFRFENAYVFKLIPVVLAVGFSWLVCWILTITDVLEVGSAARTDDRLTVVDEAPWIRVPYPCQWGMPEVTFAGVVGVLAGVLATIVESIGDYYACAKLAGAPPPPPHAINRGIFIEGVGTILAGLFGTGSGTTSYSQNIGAIAVTKVGSRRVILYSGMIMLFCGLLGKVGAVFIIIPEPIIGGIFVIVFSMITAVGLSALQNVSLSSPRNLFVLGFSLFTGLAVPMWLRSADNRNLIKTGVDSVDQVLLVLLSTSMFMGGLLGFILDNTVPGTDRERGVDKWRAQLLVVSQANLPAQAACYDLPFGNQALSRWSWTQYIPILPNFKGWASMKRGDKHQS